MKKTLTKRGYKSKSDALEANAYYCIITPKNAEDIQFLDTTTKIDILDYPIDYEVVEEGEYYIPKGVTDTILSPRYAIVENLDELPANLSVQVEDELHYPENEDEAVAYLYNKLAFGEEQLPADKDTNEYIQENKGGWYPKLYIEYRNSNGTLDVIQNVQVKIDGEILHTDTYGYVKTTKKHYGTAKVYCSFYNFYTGNIVRKGIVEFLNIDRFNKIGTADKFGYPIYLIISNNDIHCWYKASVYQAVNKYNDYCYTNGIQVAELLNIWVSDMFKSSSSPLFKKFSYLSQQSHPAQYFQNFLKIIFDNISNTLYTSLVNATYKIISNINFVPDLCIAASTYTYPIYSTCFHELSHFSHAIKRGSSFWSQVVYAESMNQINYKDPYYNGQYPDANYAAKIGLAESWAMFMEEKIDNKYGITLFKYPKTMDNFQPYTIPSSINSIKEGWMPAGLYWDLMDNTSNETIILLNNNNPIKTGNDNYNGVSTGITIQKLYNVITNSGCNSVSDFKTIFLSNYPAQYTQANNLFSLYNY